MLICIFSLNARGFESIAKIELTLDEKQSLPLASEIRFRIVSKNSSAIAESILKYNKSIILHDIAPNSLDVSISDKLYFTGDINERYITDSFVIDIESDSVKSFVAGFTLLANKPLQLERLTKYVDEYIDEPSSIHGFNIASLVAKQRSGDCKGYAVLTTALARSLELPARVMIGAVIVDNKGQVSAFGHAWTEVWQEGQWHILDSALYTSKTIRKFYLPASELENEGLGYRLSLVQAASLMPIKITHLRNF